MCAAHKKLPTPPPLDPACALFLDIDGTLLEIAPRPDLVEVPAALPSLLAQLAAQRQGALALVSGRRLADVDRLFRSWRGAAAGLHGAERRRSDGQRVATGDSAADHAAAAALDALRPRLRQYAERAPGVLLEDKGGTIAVHYRAAPERATEVHALAEELLRDFDERLRLISGKMIIELAPLHYGKSGAIAAFLSAPPFTGRTPVFLGDDNTDEDGFAEVNRRGGTSIRVGPPAQTRARYALPSVTAARAWLATG